MYEIVYTNRMKRDVRRVKRHLQTHQDIAVTAKRL